MTASAQDPSKPVVKTKDPAFCGTPVPNPGPNPGPFPPTLPVPAGTVVVRDHRHPIVVRDHRDDSGPIIRDHRDNTGPVIRDHRDDATGPVVRDHRDDDAGPIIRDHRTWKGKPIYSPVYTVPSRPPVVVSGSSGGVAVTPSRPQPVVRDHRHPTNSGGSGTSIDLPGPLPNIPLPKLPVSIPNPF